MTSLCGPRTFTVFGSVVSAAWYSLRLAAAGFVVRREQNQTPVPGVQQTLEDTALGRDALKQYLSVCMGQRKLVSILSFTAPAVAREFTVVHVAYWWTPSEKPVAWGATKGKRSPNPASGYLTPPAGS